MAYDGFDRGINFVLGINAGYELLVQYAGLKCDYELNRKTVDSLHRQFLGRINDLSHDLTEFRNRKGAKLLTDIVEEAKSTLLPHHEKELTTTLNPEA